jgi:ATP-dependent helicase HrpA
VPRTVELLREVLGQRQALLVVPQPYPGLEADLNRLVGPAFLRETPYERLTQLSRYLRAMRLRADRWKQNPVKDAERARQIAPYEAAAARKSSPTGFRWLVEEFRVSLFAQELGTAEPVSAVKLDRILQTGVMPASTAAATPPPSESEKSAPKPAPVVLPATKQAPLKNLSSLGKLFPR